jgi:hypothetical protein
MNNSNLDLIDWKTNLWIEREKTTYQISLIQNRGKIAQTSKS